MFPTPLQQLTRFFLELSVILHSLENEQVLISKCEYTNSDFQLRIKVLENKPLGPHLLLATTRLSFSTVTATMSWFGCTHVGIGSHKRQ